MQVFPRALTRTHCVGAAWPEPVGTVALGEPFVVEGDAPGPAGLNGPIRVAGVRAGDAPAVHLEAIDLRGPFVAPNGGPFDALPQPELAYRDGWFYFPAHFRLRARPSVGNVAVLPWPTSSSAPRAPRGAWCSTPSAERAPLAWRPG